MKWGILIILIAALFADLYIYRSVVSDFFRRLPARIGYILWAIATDCLGLSIFFLYGPASSKGSGAVITVMWLVWVFLLTAFPKILFSVGAFLDWLVYGLSRRRITLFRWLGVLLSACVTVMMVCGATVGRHKFRVEEITVSSPRVPEGFDGYRIVQFSDLHIGTMCRPEERIAEMAAIIDGLRPDLVVNTGDLVNIDYRDLTPEAVSELSRIEARDGVISVYGNHDLGFYISDTLSLPLDVNIRSLENVTGNLGWRTLSDETLYIRRGADSIAVTGLNFPPDRNLSGHNEKLSGVDLEKAFDGVPAGTYNVVLSHAPQMWRDVTESGYGDLTLSGHVHSMQVKLSLFGLRWSPARLLYKEWSGLYGQDARPLYINDGIGCVGFPMRIGTRPEITLITLERCE